VGGRRRSLMGRWAGSLHGYPPSGSHIGSPYQDQPDNVIFWFEKRMLDNSLIRFSVFAKPINVVFGAKNASATSTVCNSGICNTGPNNSSGTYLSCWMWIVLSFPIRCLLLGVHLMTLLICFILCLKIFQWNQLIISMYPFLCIFSK
jgi:hypothetical protein